MKFGSKLLLLLVSVVSVYSQWSEPIRIRTLASDDDEFAPSWSPADSSLYLVRTHAGNLVVLQCRHCTSDQLLGGENLQLDTVSDSVVYTSFNGKQWVGHRLVMGQRQRYAELVIAPRATRESASTVPIRELSEAEEFTMYPALSPNGQQLVFATTRSNTDGTMDLWSTQWLGDRWGLPYRLAGFEQSAGNEITPCFMGNDTLVFASDGFGGKGGFDLFMTVFRAGLWSPPVPLTVLNSATDDRDPCILPNGDLIFISNRAGSFDLYYARRAQNERLPK